MKLTWTSWRETGTRSTRNLISSDPGIFNALCNVMLTQTCVFTWGYYFYNWNKFDTISPRCAIYMMYFASNFACEIELEASLTTRNCQKVHCLQFHHLTLRPATYIWFVASTISSSFDDKVLQEQTFNLNLNELPHIQRCSYDHSMSHIFFKKNKENLTIIMDHGCLSRSA